MLVFREALKVKKPTMYIVSEFIKIFNNERID